MVSSSLVGAGDMDARTVQAILDKLDVLARKVDGLDARFDGLERKVDALQQVSSRVDALDRKVTATIRNAPLRSRNSPVMHPVSEVHRLLSVLTGEPLDPFPETLDDLDRLEEPVVDHLLKHLGQDLDGGRCTCLHGKRRHLGNALGIVLRAV